ncbi:hypothetical protein PR202_gb09675 [Eleusine coracana subsp. coracana]|uniref:Peptidase S49 domain-containing protein n=1 Tax=Eleusine coracana subsp. coracana TaxID=191504 RepID=A0AAV5EI03_ELECO|nr:hypothetical protein PR202_gb09675 [Eleusine coracana subsp. coracana]
MARLLVLRAAPYRHSSHLSTTTLLVLSPSKHRNYASFPSCSPSPARRVLPLPLRVPTRAVESSPGPTKEEQPPGASGAQEPPPAAPAFEVEELGWGTQLAVKLRMLVEPPWKRVRKGSVLNMKLRGEVLASLWHRAFLFVLLLMPLFRAILISEGLILIYVLLFSYIRSVEDTIRIRIVSTANMWTRSDGTLWISRSLVNSLLVMPVCGEKEYYLACACGELYAPPSAYIALFGLTVQQTFLRGVLEKIGVEPEIQRIGKYKSAGDQLARKSMSNEIKEMLSTLLDNIYGNWLDTISALHGKKKEEIEEFINSGVYQVARLKEEGWITDLLYDDEVMEMLKERIGQKDKKNLRMVDYSKYSRVSKRTLGLQGGGEQIAIIRASGSITRTRSPLSVPSSGIIAEQLIDKIRTVRESDKYKAVILRIDSPGGDALASDLMWREIRLLANSKPVVASMSDVAASGGYYMAMAAPVIVAEKLTLTGSIGVVTVCDKFFCHQIDQMEVVAQGRVWSGQDAFSRGLVDSLGGVSQALAIAKQKANIPKDKKVQLVEILKPSPTLPEILSGIGGSLLGVDRAMKGVLQDVILQSGVQARMDGIIFESLGDMSGGNQLFVLIKDLINCFE